MTSHARIDAAGLLLEYVPLSERGAAVNNVAKQITPTSTLTDIGLLASLLQLQPEHTAKQTLLENLSDRIENGQAADVSSFCEAFPSLREQLLLHSIANIERVANLVKQDEKWLSVPMSTKDIAELVGAHGSSPGFEEQAADSEEQVRAAFSQAVSHFASIGASLSHLNENGGALLRSCLILVGVSDRKLASEAQRTLSRMISASHTLAQSDRESLWRRIQELMGASDKHYQLIGSAIWSRWAMSPVPMDASTLNDPAYWRLLVSGLRHGDAERRKGVLQILRASVDNVAELPALILHIVVRGHDSPDISQVRQQYSRFCTIFETIVLGRYLNQVQQCEPDLDFLTSPQSLIKPVWFYTLLASALDHQIQDSNRKFIGNWILRSQLRVDDHDDFIHFLQETLLPWAMQGYLFTSSLRHDDNGALVCRHGENLALYLIQLLGRKELRREDIVDAMLDNVLRKANNNFAYAMVYIFEGLGSALDSKDPPQLSHLHLEKANKMVVWTGLLPEVARDYILARLWKMCFDYRSAHQADLPSQVIEDAAKMWEKTLLKAQSPEENQSAQLSGSVSSLSPTRSRRDLNEAETIDKCYRAIKRMGSSDDTLNSAELVAQLEDIWSDLEYLEFPKSLLTVIPDVLLHDRLPTIMQQGDVSTGSREQLERMIRDLLKQSDSKAYLLYPLLQRIRHNFMHKTTSPEFLDIDDFVIHLAEKPPAPTVDALLEDATAKMMSAISPETKVFDHEFYCGKRESHGFAAFLDLVSRIHAIESGAPERIAQRILQRWMRQKTPPPTVSQWKTVLQLQVLSLCLEQHVPSLAATEAERILKDLHYILSIEPLPTYRYLLEWMIARIHLHHASLRSILLAELRIHDHHSNPKFLASLMKIGVSVVKAPNSTEEFGSELMAIFATLAASSKVVIRHEAQWQIPALLDQAAAKQWELIRNNTTFKALDDFVRSLQRFGDPPLDRRIDKLDPVADHNLTHLVEGPWYELDNVEQRQTNHECFVSLYVSDAQHAIQITAVSCMPLGDAPAATASSSSTSKDPDSSKKVLQNIESINNALASGSNSTILQTKGAAYLESSNKRHSNLLVVASLIDNPYNLGGLSRVSEVFGAGGLYMSNTTVTGNREFSGVSVSSHLHIPLHSLQASQLQSFLAAKKQNEGFTVCGIEQTDRSVMLGSAACVLPEKCILVMGSEKEGIPALILSECDLLIEIPQVGITRSLNVQTAAGIVLCEYAKQHKL